MPRSIEQVRSDIRDMDAAGAPPDDVRKYIELSGFSYDELAGKAKESEPLGALDRAVLSQMASEKGQAAYLGKRFGEGNVRSFPPQEELDRPPPPNAPPGLQPPNTPMQRFFSGMSRIPYFASKQEPELEFRRSANEQFAPVNPPGVDAGDVAGLATNLAIGVAPLAVPQLRAMRPALETGKVLGMTPAAAAGSALASHVLSRAVGLGASGGEDYLGAGPEALYGGATAAMGLASDLAPEYAVGTRLGKKVAEKARHGPTRVATRAANRYIPKLADIMSDPGVVERTSRMSPEMQSTFTLGERTGAPFIRAYEDLSRRLPFTRKIWHDKDLDSFARASANVSKFADRLWNGSELDAYSFGSKIRSSFNEAVKKAYALRSDRWMQTMAPAIAAQPDNAGVKMANVVKYLDGQIADMEHLRGTPLGGLVARFEGLRNNLRMKVQRPAPVDPNATYHYVEPTFVTEVVEKFETPHNVANLRSDWSKSSRRPREYLEIIDKADYRRRVSGVIDAIDKDIEAAISDGTLGGDFVDAYRKAVADYAEDSAALRQFDNHALKRLLGFKGDAISNEEIDGLMRRLAPSKLTEVMKTVESVDPDVAKMIQARTVLRAIEEATEGAGAKEIGTLPSGETLVFGANAFRRAIPKSRALQAIFAGDHKARREIEAILDQMHFLQRRPISPGSQTMERQAMQRATTVGGIAGSAAVFAWNPVVVGLTLAGTVIGDRVLARAVSSHDGRQAVKAALKVASGKLSPRSALALRSAAFLTALQSRDASPSDPKQLPLREPEGSEPASPGQPPGNP